MAYESILSRGVGVDRACVLGMTPELRGLAGNRFRRICSVDSSNQAIDLYREWVDPDVASREKILLEDWFEFLAKNRGTFDAVLGDGIFGNLPDLASHRKLLGLIKEALKSGGVFATRMALIPKGFNPDNERWELLRDRFRRHSIDAAEFGLGVRLIGHYGCCYDAERFMLDNPKLFMEMGTARDAQLLDEREYGIIGRYYFNGLNCIIPEQVWEGVLREGGFVFRKHVLTGKTWYEYYPVYECRPS